MHVSSNGVIARDLAPLSSIKRSKSPYGKFTACGRVSSGFAPRSRVCGPLQTRPFSSCKPSAAQCEDASHSSGVERILTAACATLAAIVTVLCGTPMMPLALAVDTPVGLNGDMDVFKSRLSSLTYKDDVLTRLPTLPSQFPAMNDLKAIDYIKFTLPNGMRVFMLQDEEVPLVKAGMLINGGQHASPVDKVGLATLSAGVQRSGGSQQHPAETFDDALEQLAASIEGGAGEQAFSFGFTCLRDDAPAVMSLFAELIRQPAIPQAKLDQLRASVLNAIEHRNDSASGVAARELVRLMYGRDSLYARIPSPQQINGITTSDIHDFLETWERPDNAVMGIVGDFDVNEMRALVEANFGTWAPAAAQPSQPPRIVPQPFPPQTSAGKVYVVDRAEGTQWAVAMGEPGVSLTSPDVFALDVLGGIFNSFGGRLFDEVRSREGLAYSVSGGWDTPTDHDGVFLVRGDTASPAEFLTAVRRVFDEATQQLPTDVELAAAKDETLNSFVFNFASKAAQLRRIVIYDLLGVPEDYLYTYKRGIENVSADDVLEAAKAHLHVRDQSVVIVGNAAAVRPALQQLDTPVVELKLDDKSLMYVEAQ